MRDKKQLHVEVRGQFVGVGSFHYVGSLGLNSSGQAWQKAL